MRMRTWMLSKKWREFRDARSINDLFQIIIYMVLLVIKLQLIRCAWDQSNVDGQDIIHVLTVSNEYYYSF